MKTTLNVNQQKWFYFT